MNNKEMIHTTKLEIEKFVLERVKTEARWFMSQQELDSVEIKTYYDYVTGQLVLTLCMIQAGRHATYSHPETWWDGFKGKYFPKWALKRWPVKYKVVQATQIFPEIPVWMHDKSQNLIEYFGQQGLPK